MRKSANEPGKGMNRRDFLKYSAAGAAGAFVSAFLPGCVSYQSTGQKINAKRHNYFDKGFLEYPEELGKLCDKYWEEKKPVEYVSTLVRQLFSIGNDILELPCEITADVADTIGYNLLGVKKKGEENKYIVKKFVKFVFDSIPGGKGNDEIVDRVARFDLDGAFEYARQVEDTELGANMKIGLVVFSNYVMIDTALKAAFGGENALVRHGDGKAAVPVGPGLTPPDPF